MLFSKNEQIILIAALETYNDEPRKDFDPFTQRILVSSALKKLNKLSESTSFTPAEFKVMYLSLSTVCSSFAKITGEIPFTNHTILLERLRAML